MKKVSSFKNGKSFGRRVDVVICVFISDLAIFPKYLPPSNLYQNHFLFYLRTTRCYIAVERPLEQRYNHTHTPYKETGTQPHKLTRVHTRMHRHIYTYNIYTSNICMYYIYYYNTYSYSVLVVVVVV